MEELEFFDKRVKKGIIDYLKSISKSSFKRITYTEIIEILEKAIKDGK